MTKDELAAEVEAFKVLYATLKTTKQNKPKRGKYDRVIQDFKKNGLPVMRLNESQFNNTSEASMQQQFNKAMEKAGIENLSVLCVEGQGKFLIDFDDNRAEEAFARMLENINSNEVTGFANELLYVTNGK